MATRANFPVSVAQRSGQHEETSLQKEGGEMANPIHPRMISGSKGKPAVDCFRTEKHGVPVGRGKGVQRAGN